MGLKVFNRVSRRYLEGAVLVVVSSLLGGCSSDFTRFTDGIYTGSTSSQQAVVQKPIPRYQQMPPAVQGGTAYSPIESSELPPLPVPNSEPMTQTASLGIATPPPIPGAPPRTLAKLPASEAKRAEAKPAMKKTAAADQHKTYIVQGGDTLYGISRRNNTSVDKLKRENGLSSDTILVGQALTVPGEANKAAGADSTQVAELAVPKPVPEPVAAPHTKTDTPETPVAARNVETVTAKPEVKEAAQSAAPQVEKAVASAADTTRQAQEVAVVAPQATGVSSALMRWPARGRILSRYGQREGTTTNDGMDIMVPEGTPVNAADSGVVIYAGDGLKEFGKTVLIRHENNIVTVYGHNSKILVQRGQKVRRGDEIAKSGMSGNAPTPRLHFEVRKNSAPVNPVKYLEN